MDDPTATTWDLDNLDKLILGTKRLQKRNFVQITISSELDVVVAFLFDWTQSAAWPINGPPMAHPTSKVVDMYPETSVSNPKDWFNQRGNQK